MTNVVSMAALVAALVALLYAWRLHKELDRATARLDRYNKALFDAGEELRQLRTRLAPEDHGQNTPNITLEV